MDYLLLNWNSILGFILIGIGFIIFIKKLRPIHKIKERLSWLIVCISLIFLGAIFVRFFNNSGIDTYPDHLDTIRYANHNIYLRDIYGN